MLSATITCDVKPTSGRFVSADLVSGLCVYECNSGSYMHNALWLECAVPCDAHVTAFDAVTGACVVLCDHGFWMNTYSVCMECSSAM